MPFLCPTVNRFVLRLLAPSNNEFHSEGEGLRRGRERVKCTKGEGEGKYHSPGLCIRIRSQILGLCADSASEQGWSQKATRQIQCSPTNVLCPGTLAYLESKLGTITEPKCDSDSMPSSRGRSFLLAHLSNPVLKTQWWLNKDKRVVDISQMN